MSEYTFAMLASILLGTFIHEDIAIFAASYLIVEHGLSWYMALGAIYIGIVASDASIYGLGAAARYLQFMQSLMINPRIMRMKYRLNSHLFSAIVACHLLPGILFPTFIACGWYKLSFRRFIVASAFVAALYASVTLTLMVLFGKVIMNRIGFGAWLIIAFIILAIIVRSRRNIARELDPVVFANTAELEDTGPSQKHAYQIDHKDKAFIASLQHQVSQSERIPSLIFYAPVFIQWLFLAFRHRSITLPTIANPNIEMGGLWGESKSDLLNQVGIDQRHWLTPFIVIQRTVGNDSLANDLKLAISLLQQSGISFPIVAKPDIGWQGYGVQHIASADSLLNYMKQYPQNEKLILQRNVPNLKEAGVFYIRMPGEKHGHVESLTFRYYPFLLGDGKTTVRQLMTRNERANFKIKWYRNHSRHLGLSNEVMDSIPDTGEVVRLSFICSLRVGGSYYDAKEYISPDLTKRFDAICLSIPEFYFGRFDIHFQSTDLLRKGEGFSIFEINGAGSEAIHIWDPRKSVRSVYSELFRFQSMMFTISERNRKRGHNPIGLWKFLRFTWHYQHVLRQYPPSS